jgi:hypothetical protein
MMVNYYNKNVDETSQRSRRARLPCSHKSNLDASAWMIDPWVYIRLIEVELVTILKPLKQKHGLSTIVETQHGSGQIRPTKKIRTESYEGTAIN